MIKKYVESTDIVDLEGLHREMAQLRSRIPTVMVLAGEMTGKVFRVEDGRDLVVGRDPDTDITIDLNPLSRRHCRFFRTDDKVFVEDLGSTNGTFVNGVRIKKRLLISNERVFLADICALKFILADEVELFVNQYLFGRATTDALTGLSNRLYFEENLRREFSFHRRAGLPMSLLMFDLDDFKQINDTHGHPAGDEVLRVLGHLVRTHLREEDVLARCGGEEFAIILKNTNAAAARAKAESLRALIADTSITFEGKEIRVTASFGQAALCGSRISTPEEMVAIADTRMYQAKRAGKDRVMGPEDCPDDAG